MRNKHPFWMKPDWRGARPLTLRELIMKSNFQTMMKEIIAFDPKMTNQETPQGTCRGRKRKEGRGRRGRKEPLNMG